jgi:aryl-alcohol dehydrogenase-like predicted oxidoreductase
MPPRNEPRPPGARARCPPAPASDGTRVGRTGERVSAIGLGGWYLALPHVDEALSHRLVRTAIDRGITFMDNSWDYNEGRSELRMARRSATAGGSGSS